MFEMLHIEGKLDAQSFLPLAASLVGDGDNLPGDFMTGDDSRTP